MKAGSAKKKGDQGSSSNVTAASSAGETDKKMKGGARSLPMCYLCNKPGHIRPNFPELNKSVEATPAKVI